MNRFDIGRRIGSYREKLKLSTQELANRIKRSQATISRIENGKQGITPEILVNIARELGVHPFALLTDQPLRHLQDSPSPTNAADDCASTLLAFALQTGRINRDFQFDEAADFLDIPASELHSYESGAAQPDGERLNSLCGLYGLNPAEMQYLAEIDRRSPAFSRRLAGLQGLVEKIMNLCNQAKPGDESKTLRDIHTIIHLAYSENPLPVNSAATELGLIVNSDPELLSTALQEQEFFSHMNNILTGDTLEHSQPDS